MRGGSRSEAMMSSRILNPIADSRRAALSNTSRRNMKNPLIGSDTGVRSTIPASLVAREDMPARVASHVPMPPPAM